jgi:hypothetical protein
MMPLRPDTKVLPRKPVPGSMARGAIRETSVCSLQAMRDPRHAKTPQPKASKCATQCADIRVAVVHRIRHTIKAQGLQRTI